MIVKGSGLEGVELQQGPQGQFFFQLNDVVLYDADGNPGTTGDQVLANGSLTAEMGVDFDLEIGFFEIDKLYFTAWAVETSNLELSAYVASTSLPPAEIMLISYTLNPFVVQIRPVPIVMVPELSFVVGVNGEVYVGITTSVTQTLTASVGAGYADGQWGAHNDFENESSWSPPEPTAGLQVKGYLGPQLTLELYGVAGPYTPPRPI